MITLKTAQNEDKKPRILSILRTIFLSFLVAAVATTIAKVIIQDQITSWVFIGLSILSILTFCLTCIALETEIRKSKLHKQISYIDFLFWVSFFLCIFLTCDNYTKHFLFLSFPSKGSLYWFCSGISWNISALPFLVISVAIIFLKCKTKSLDITKLKRRFAPESKSSNKDDLGFNTSATEAAKTIINPEKYVTVVALNGGYGEGKSSYARMIIEEVGAKKSLYSYISLTETNATNDFSNSFAERWFETLNERYPTINIAPHVASLEAILRESTNHSALVSAISQTLVKLNFGLSKTVAKCCDSNFKTEKQQQKKEYFVPNSTAAMFNHIPKIKEDVWIINIDEIERAQLDEIYRVIEVIERFKHEGRFGLPVKLVFLLCVSGSDLQKRLTDLKSNGNEKAQLIEDFFFNNPKSRDQNLFLPPVSYEKKKEFVVKSLNEVLGKKEFGLQKISDLKNYQVTKTTDRFYEEDEGLSWIVDHLTQESPRTIIKVCQELEFFYHCFKDLSGNIAAQSLAICDAITMSLIKMKYPFLIEVLKFYTSRLEVFDQVTVKDKPEERVLEIASKSFSDDWTKEMIAKKLDQFIDLLGLISYKLCKSNTHNASLGGIRSYRRTSSNQTMKGFLSFYFDNNNVIYEKTYSSKNHQSEVVKLSDKDLPKYSYELLKTNNSSWEKYLDVATELLKRMDIGSKRDFSDEFLWTISSAIEFVSTKIEETETAKQAREKIWQSIKDFLKSEKITIVSKYHFLDAFANKTGSSSSDSKKRNDLFEYISKDKERERKTLIEDIFNDAKKRYFAGEESVYANENDFANLLYQSWCGKQDVPRNTSPITKAAIRDLKNHPRAIEYYWEKYTSGQEEFGIISLKDLRKITKEADEITKDENAKNALLDRLKGISNLPLDQTNSEPKIENFSGRGSKPLMMAMIDQGYIDESVSFFE